MTDKFLQWLVALIHTGDVHPFYVTPEWRALSRRIISQDKECQICKARGSFGPADLVHHVKHVKQHPSLALDEFFFEDGQRRRNLISVCRDCHETVCHPERLRKRVHSGYANQERWD